MNYPSFISWGILSVSAMLEETASISFFLQEAQYYFKNIYKFLFFLMHAWIMQNLSAWNLLPGKISCFFTEGIKGYFLLFQNVILYFCPFKRDTKIINSFSLLHCKKPAEILSIHFNMVNFLQFSNLLDALLNACFSQTVLAFKAVINNSWKRFKVPVDKT